ncbi:30S ribosomal protein S1 isoform X2 [Rhodamnia argentea]|uniref:30S ribosomal protein S1 isoform X2 n=1 Tax=Rhodamnia argentea TaxID=178133 RepID=A0ABM3GSA7_9MYRT|nr:30S ribosomal protein S1 isoform X2 [Rhodamnia argentea]
MPILTANLGLAGSSSITLFALSQLFTGDATSASMARHNGGSPKICLKYAISKRPFSFHGVVRASVSVSGDAYTKDGEEEAATASANAANGAPHPDAARQARRSADWKAARAYTKSGLIYTGRVEGFNGGGLLVQFYSLVGFLPFPQLSPSHSCKDKNIQEVAKALIGSVVPVKVIQADEDGRRLIFSEKEAVWSKFSEQINVGDIFQARVGSVEDYGAFVHLRFPDGLYHLTGLVHVSEVSWDLVQDVRDILSEGDEVRVKVINIDREKSRITLSMKQLEEDPLLETLDKVIPQDGSVNSDASGTNSSSKIDPLPGLETIIQELLQEEGIEDVSINRQGFEKRVVSQDLQLWLSNAPPINKKFILLARAGRQVQEIQLTTLLDQDGIKRALQRVLERVP